MSTEELPVNPSSYPQIRDNERSFDFEGSEASEINETILRHLEGDIFKLQMEVRQKDNEIHALTEGLSQIVVRSEKVNQMEAVLSLYEKEILEMKIEIEERRKQADHDRIEIEMAKKTLENSKGTIEALQEENQRMKDEMAGLTAENKKLSSLLQEKEEDKNEVIDFSLVSYPQMREFETEKVINVSFCDLDNLSTHESEVPNLMKPVFIKGMYDKVLLAKLEFLKAKLLNEERKNKEFEFLTKAQKKNIEDANETVRKLKEEKRDMEDKIEALEGELEEMKELRMRDKAKLENVTAFYQLMQNSREVPSYEGSPTFQVNDGLIEKAQKMGKDSAHKKEALVQEIGDIKSELSNLTQFVQNAVTVQERMRSKTEPKKPNLDSNWRMHLFRAMQNSTSFWHILQSTSTNTNHKESDC